MKSVFSILLLLSLSITAFAEEERLTSVSDDPAGKSYFKILIQDSGLLSGNYPGWCGDWTVPIEHDVFYKAKFYSSYSEIPEGLVDLPENLDEVNWIMNQRFPGKNSPLGVYTAGDVQLAIWSLLDTYHDDSSIGEYSPERVELIVSKAKALGSGFYPTCKQVVGILLAPTDRETGTRAQTTITEVPRSHFPKCVIPENDGSGYL